MKVRGSRSRDDITAFLETQTIPVRLGCQTPSGHLWMVSLWYRYRPGETDENGDDWRLECATSASADVVSYLRENPGVAFEISTNEPPYAGVRGRGSASMEPDPEKEVLRDLLERYLGGTESELARSLLREDRDEVVITIDPAVVYGWDFSERM
ncbi:pyridoxamine 5'-phosphate oxidase [Natronococcus pandeyae]|uniref:Pyridoxamine 5'-phosphate oxidase n=1 Tax=Natronococcus pandeyae TaxID=2055836 RepID=A0A8J8Q851_9EURY|nr:pyridoxamine 5'-phosphate oxidase family protein [Natronococcus pandeyae]TYL40573.1 pyridoxamine 5'-phosphate oxidase [Natronococcus pandeyae]